MRSTRRPDQRQLRILHLETDNCQCLAGLALERRLVQLHDALFHLDLSAYHFPLVTLLQHHLHLELPRVEVCFVELVDVIGSGGVHGKGEVSFGVREAEAWAHNLFVRLSSRW